MLSLSNEDYFESNDHVRGSNTLKGNYFLVEVFIWLTRAGRVAFDEDNTETWVKKFDLGFKSA